MRYEISVIIELDANSEEHALDRMADLFFILINDGQTDLDWRSFGAREADDQ